LASTEIFELLPVMGKKTRNIYVDPVCHIRLNETETNISFVDDGVEYFFCSQECKKIFREHDI
jgi:YHS domain-containing protein